VVTYGSKQPQLRSPFRALVYRLALAVFGLVSIPLHAKTLAIIVSLEGARYHEIARDIERELQSTPKLQVLRLKSSEIDPRGTVLAAADILLTIGNEAAEKALQQRGARPLLCTFLSQSAFETELLQHFDSIDAGLTAGISALYFEQPPQRIFQLARMIVPEARVAGLALGPVLQTQQPRLEQQALQVKLELRTAVVSPDSNPVEIFEPLVTQTDLMIALPDKAQWHSQTAKWLLYVAYQRSKPVIAFSERFTEVGAVASLYTKPRDIADQATAITLEMLDKPGPGQIYWPEKFHISTNPSVARSLGLRLLDEKDYRSKISSGGALR
jgi:ABC-type uncharacterized transport system substrate-binding protein